MRKGRLRRWAKWLRNFKETKKRHWDMGVVRSDRLKCGTAACAVGWLPNAFPEAWIAARHNKGMALIADPVYLRTSQLTAGSTYEDVAKFFGIMIDSVDYIAEPSNYDVPCEQITPEMVADRIEQMIDDGE